MFLGGSFPMHHVSSRRMLTALALALLALLSIVFIQSAQTTNAAPVTGPAHINELKSGAEGVQFTLNVPEISIDANGTVTADGLTARIANVGAPALPYYSAMIALPPEADVSAEISIVAVSNKIVSSVAPAPDANREKLQAGELVTSIEEDLGLTFEEDAAIYGQNSSFPDVLYEISEPMYMRDLRVVQLTIYPVRYNPVANQLTHAQQIDVALSFTGADFSNARTAAWANGNAGSESIVLNSDDARNWHALPSNTPNAETNFPIGVETAKIEVEEDGIYEVTYADLQGLGFNVGAINPSTFEMMHNGTPVAYEFVGDTDATFESGEAVRFYGWAFDGPRHDRQFANKSVFWLWAGGTPDTIATGSNPTGNAAVASWTSTVTKEEDNLWNQTSTSQWLSAEAGFDNEADAWYMSTFRVADRATPHIESINLPHPAASGPDANFVVELFSVGPFDNHKVHVTINGANQQDATWDLIFSKNLSPTIPLADLSNGPNTVNLWADTLDPTGDYINGDRFLVNRITATYEREFSADNDELIFSYPTAGSHEFVVDGFSTNNAANVMVWDISDRQQPERIPVAASDISAGSSFAYRIGSSNHPANAAFIATTTSNVSAPSNISKYTGSSLEPANGGADWVMVVHSSMMGNANDLAAHRAATSNLKTHVVDVEDIYNQYGYGYELPSAITAYAQHGLLDWSTPLSYLVLGGDATINPLQLDCVAPLEPNCGTWNTTKETYVVADIVAIDRFQGYVPSDHTFSMLVGNDIIPDISVGRLTAATPTEMANMVDKIVAYDQSITTSQPWTNSLLFLSDDADAGGQFCDENAGVIANNVPDTFETTALCLDDYLEANDNDELISVAQMRADTFNFMNGTSAGLLNYRGHGSVDRWAGQLVTTGHSNQWLNLGKPTVILSADCLDGNFAFLHVEALSETFLALGQQSGTAAHWSSSGLGYSHEHTILHKAFYDGLYDAGEETIGDAIKYAKTAYVSNGSGDDSEVYSFILQGDPAMRMPGSFNGTSLYLPILSR